MQEREMIRLISHLIRPRCVRLMEGKRRVEPADTEHSRGLCKGEGNGGLANT